MYLHVFLKKFWYLCDFVGWMWWIAVRVDMDRVLFWMTGMGVRVEVVKIGIVEDLRDCDDVLHGWGLLPPFTTAPVDCGSSPQ